MEQEFQGLTSFDKYPKVILEKMEKYLTTKEVARLLKVKEITVRRWVNREWLPAFRMGREFRIKKIDLEKYGKFDRKKKR